MNRRTFLGRLLATPVALAGVAWGANAGGTGVAAVEKVGERRVPIYIDGLKQHRDQVHPGIYSTINGDLYYSDDLGCRARCVINYDCENEFESIHIDRIGGRGTQKTWCRVVKNYHA